MNITPGARIRITRTATDHPSHGPRRGATYVFDGIAVTDAAGDGLMFRGYTGGGEYISTALSIADDEIYTHKVELLD